MLRTLKMAVGAALVLATASAAVAQGNVGGSHPNAGLVGHRSLAASDWGYDGYGCTNYAQFLYDSHDCHPQQ